jgi:feruloyl esterase
MRFKPVLASMALTIALTGLGLGLAPGTASAMTTSPSTSTPPSTIQPVRSCAELVKDFDLPGAATHVTRATVVAAGVGEPEHCDVRGYVEPAVAFQLRLPTTTYAGRYLQHGCGGFCGVISPPSFPACGGTLPGDMAVAATDDGHVGHGPIPVNDGSWAANNQVARDDWFYRAPHVLSVAAKRIIGFYYGSPPTRSYFTGCSNGGREALLLAQRYPDDFDGVVAAAPANILGPLGGVYLTWLARTNTAGNGAPIITSAKLPALHNAVVAACDHLDGLVDGQIDDPRVCRFNPVTVQCATGTDRPSCLTPAQVDAARKLYAGPTDADGRRLYPGWQTFGSELGWDQWVVPIPDLGVSVAGMLADNYLKYIGYPVGAPHSSSAEFSFTVGEFNRLTPEGVKGNAMSLDLAAFQRSGGKLIIWHGWADQGIPAVGTLDYYQRLWQRSGGLRKTQEWARLFMVPTMYHCADGYRLTEFDPFGALVGWVEHGKAPERVVANGRDAQGDIVRSRPVFPYPLRAKYDGTGSVDDAGNFLPERPPAPPSDIIGWAGTDLYARPGPVASG